MGRMGNLSTRFGNVTNHISYTPNPSGVLLGIDFWTLYCAGSPFTDNPYVNIPWQDQNITPKSQVYSLGCRAGSIAGPSDGSKSMRVRMAFFQGDTPASQPGTLLGVTDIFTIKNDLQWVDFSVVQTVKQTPGKPIWFGIQQEFRSTVTDVYLAYENAAEDFGEQVSFSNPIHDRGEAFLSCNAGPVMRYGWVEII